MLDDTTGGAQDLQKRKWAQKKNNRASKNIIKPPTQKEGKKL